MKAKKYLKGGQVKLDANKDGKISGKDFSMLRKGMKKYQKGGKAPKGEIDLGKGSYKGMTLSDAEELNRRVGENYGKHASDIRTGYKGLDSRMDEIESDKRQAFARAGGLHSDKGIDCINAAVEMVQVIQQLDKDRKRNNFRF